MQNVMMIHKSAAVHSIHAANASDQHRYTRLCESFLFSTPEVSVRCQTEGMTSRTDFRFFTNDVRRLSAVADYLIPGVASVVTMTVLLVAKFERQLCIALLKTLKV